MRHDCNRMFNNKAWSHCCICDGRMHYPECSTKMNKNRDCCPARHKMLHDAGQVRGISDNSFFMWSETYPEGYHQNDIKYEAKSK